MVGVVKTPTTALIPSKEVTAIQKKPEPGRLGELPQTGGGG